MARRIKARERLLGVNAAYNTTSSSGEEQIVENELPEEQPFLGIVEGSPAVISAAGSSAAASPMMPGGIAMGGFGMKWPGTNP